MSEAGYQKQIIRNICDLGWSLRGLGWEGGWKGQCVLICHISSSSFPGLFILLMEKMFVFPSGWGTDSSCRMARLTFYGSMSCFHKALLAPSLHKCCSFSNFHQVSLLSTHPPYKWLIPLCLWQLFPRAGLWAVLAVLFLGYWQGLAFSWERAQDKSPSFLSQKVSVVVQCGWRAMLPQLPRGRRMVECPEEMHCYEQP